MRSGPDPWLVGQRRPEALLRLFCFSHAGGHPAGYLPWQAALGPQVEVRAVQLPGRAMRFHERSYREFDALAAELVAMLERHADLPFVLFGHSLGALLAFELARACGRRGLAPLQVFVSGCGAPRLRRLRGRLHELGDDELCRELGRYNGTPAEVLADRELMQLLLPVVRDDFALVDGYRYVVGPALTVPLTVLAGRDDAEVPADIVPAWSDEAAAGCEVLWFDGGHFFIESARPAVLECLRQRLDALLDRRARLPSRSMDPA